jgi:hypothetical protein
MLLRKAAIPANVKRNAEIILRPMSVQRRRKARKPDFPREAKAHAVKTESPIY